MHLAFYPLTEREREKKKPGEYCKDGRTATKLLRNEKDKSLPRFLLLADIG